VRGVGIAPIVPRCASSRSATGSFPADRFANAFFIPDIQRLDVMPRRLELAAGRPGHFLSYDVGALPRPSCWGSGP